MSGVVCRAASIALTGLQGTAVMVESAVSQQLPGIAIIGLPDAALAEAKLRVRTATAQVGLPLSDRFHTIKWRTHDVVCGFGSTVIHSSIPGSGAGLAVFASTEEAHVTCDGDCDPRVPSCPVCDLHPMRAAGRWWVCECGAVLVPRPTDPVLPG